MIADWIVQSSIVSLVILVAVHAARGRSAAMREALLLVALVKFVIPPSVLLIADAGYTPYQATIAISHRIHNAIETGRE